MKVNVSHEAFMRAIESLNDPEHGNPSKSEFLAAHNVKSIVNQVYVGSGYTLEFSSDADATLFLLRFS
jgi:hypothetical protein